MGQSKKRGIVYTIQSNGTPEKFDFFLKRKEREHLLENKIQK
jgi:hypothetical protein